MGPALTLRTSACPMASSRQLSSSILGFSSPIRKSVLRCSRSLHGAQAHAKFVSAGMGDRTRSTSRSPSGLNMLPCHSVVAPTTRRVSGLPISTTTVNDGSQTSNYAPPTTGVLSLLPKSAVPYAELIRLDKPTGTYYLFFPCLFSTLLASTIPPLTSPVEALSTSFLFLTGALVMRGAGCTINDLWDRNLDPQVARTRLRPIARGAVSVPQALIFTSFQLLAGLAVLLQFPMSCFFYATPSLILVGLYPLAKRVTHYPQFVLGLTFSWGVIVGFPAVGIDLLTDTAAASSAALLYASNVAWTILYDIIYAHMDIRDDGKAGIKSIALRHEAQTKPILSGLALVQVGLLWAAGAAVGAGPMFIAGSCGGAALTLALMIRKVNLKSVESCWWWFRNGCLLTGGAISAGIAAELGVRWQARNDLLLSGTEEASMLLEEEQLQD
ncbi:MAG: hypothetical protein M1825_000852 [Sarcosagium campestre]|nr:MAG: hypothetical protein M1825_000852 [Sarcosagium campestre]